MNIEDLKLSEDTAPKAAYSSHNAWFSVEGTNIVRIEYIVDRGRVLLWTIETNPKFRNQGFARKAFELLKEHNEVDCIYHDGEYTPEGFEFLAKHLITPNEIEKQVKPLFRSMNFVHDWQEKNLER